MATEKLGRGCCVVFVTVVDFVRVASCPREKNRTKKKRDNRS